MQWELPMEHRALHRCAVLTAACATLLFVTGPAVSSNEARPLYELGQWHVWLGETASILMVALAIWLLRSDLRGWLRGAGYWIIAATVVEGLLGFVPEPPSASVRVWHSLLGQLLFSTTVAIAAGTSQTGRQAPRSVPRGPMMRSLATSTLAVVLLQVVLGAAFRQGVLGFAPHLLWAFAVAIFLSIAVAVILNAELTEVRPAGIVLASVAGSQILLGFTVFTMQSVDADPSILIIATTAHAVLGALTLASAVMLATLVRAVVSPGASQLSPGLCAESMTK